MPNLFDGLDIKKISTAPEPGQAVFKIEQATKSLQIPHLRLFTTNPDLLTHLQTQGFVADHKLTSQIISYIGQCRASELLIQHDLQKAPSGTGALETELLIHESMTRATEIDQLQKRFSILQTKELKIGPQEIIEQCDFKLECIAILQEEIYKLRSKRNVTKHDTAIIHNLNQAINLIDCYVFTNQRGPGRSSPDVTYNVDPNILGRINSFDDVQKFYLAINNFIPTPENIDKKITIDRCEIDRIDLLRQRHKSKFEFNNILSYVSQYPLRSILFCIAIILECMYLPLVTPTLSTFKILTFFGLHKSFILIPFCLSYTFYFIRKIFELPTTIKNIYKKIKSWIKEKPPLNPISFRSEIEQEFYTHLRAAVKVNPHGRSRDNGSSTKGFWMFLPIIPNLIQIIAEEYKRYSNWYFSYIQRNPISLMIYLIIRIGSLFLSVITPLSNIIYSAYIDIDRAIDYDLIMEPGIQTPFVDLGTSVKDETLNRTFTEKSRIQIFKFLSFIGTFFLETVKLLCIKLPLVLAFVISKLVLSILYLFTYLLIDTLATIWKTSKNLFTHADTPESSKTIYGHLLNLEKYLTNCYYKIYFAYCYQFDLIISKLDAQNIREDLEPPSFLDPSTPGSYIPHLAYQHPSVNPGTINTPRLPSIQQPDTLTRDKRRSPSP